jgi:protein-tyrosine phosphatase
MIRVLFICTGNICRSPTAEGVFRAMVKKAGLDGQISCESAGTHGYHIGEPPDLRAQQAAKQRGYDLSAQRARKVAPADFNDFDLMLAMDGENMEALARLRPPDARTHAELLLEHVGQPGPKGVPDVADPYYGSGKGFEVMLDVIEKAAAKLLASLAAKSK